MHQAGNFCVCGVPCWETGFHDWHKNMQNLILEARSGLKGGPTYSADSCLTSISCVQPILFQLANAYLVLAT